MNDNPEKIMYMRRWFALIAFAGLPLASTAQDCTLLRETDPYTKEKRVSTGFIRLQGGSFTVDADKREIVLLVNVEGNTVCFDNNSTVSIMFEGLKAKTLLRNAGTMNCEGLFQLVFRNSLSHPTLLQRLAAYRIDNLVFQNSAKKEITLTLAPDKREPARLLAACLLQEAKTLIQ